jgi:flagellar basal-body rod protein FlgG
MLQGLNTAAAGMAAQQQRLDAVANDLANANTFGYKSQRVGFRDLVYTQAGRSSVPGPRTGSGSAAVDLGRSSAQGAFERTDAPLDVAIQGDGYFRVKRPDGQTALTRDGSFHLDTNGRLVTSTGDIVQPAITIPSGTAMDAVKIDEHGTVRVGGTVAGTLDLVTVRSEDRLEAVGDNAFLPTAASGNPVRAPASTTVSQGAVEMSNVDISDAMVGMIESQRVYQLTSKAISTADRMWEIANGVKR